jgi:hypothetical protein
MAEPKYTIESDGTCWILKVERDVERIDKARKKTGEIGRKAEIIGYYGKFGGAALRMHDCMVADCLYAGDVGAALLANARAIQAITKIAANVD